MRRAVSCAALLAASCLAGCGGSTAGARAAPAPASVPAAGGGRVEAVQVPSAALQGVVRMEVYLPPDYDRNRRYPVLYMLYGYGGNENSFFGGFLSLHKNADALVAQGKIAPLIIVVPAYANSFGVNTTVEQNPDSGGGTIGPYEDVLIREVLPYVDSHYSTAAQRDQRYVGGMSMGGFAALYLALSHPDLFGKVGAHSAALWDYGATNADLFPGQRDWLYATPALRALRDPMLLARQVPLGGMRFYLDAGADDALRPKDEEMAAILRDNGAAAEWHSGAGGHELAYWSGQLDNYLLFYSPAGR